MVECFFISWFPVENEEHHTEGVVSGHSRNKHSDKPDTWMTIGKGHKEDFVFTEKA